MKSVANRKPSRWTPQRWRNLTWIAIGAVLLIRVFIGVLFPIVINRVARIYHLHCDYDRLDLSVTGGNAQIWNVRLIPDEGGNAVLQSEYCQGDISLLNLLRGRLVVYRAEADGVQLTIERTADGRIPLLARFASLAARQTPAAGATTQPSPIDLQTPLRVDALRLMHVQTRLHDEYIRPELDTLLQLDVRLSDLGVLDKPTRFDLDFYSDPMLDSLKLVGQSEGDGKSLNTTLHMVMRGLHPSPAMGYLAYLGLRPAAEDISASANGVLKLSVAADPVDGLQAALALDNGSINCDGQLAAQLDHLTLDASSITTSSAKLGKLWISGGRILARRGANGAIDALGVELPTPGASWQELRNRPVSAAPATASPGFHCSIASVAMEELQANFKDDSITPAVSLGVILHRFTAGGFDRDAKNLDAPIDFAAALSAAGIARSVEVSGQARPFAADKSFSVAASVEGFAPEAVQPYLTAAGITSEWIDGSLALKADGKFSTDTSGRTTIDARLGDMRLVDKREVLTMNDATVRGVRFDPRTVTFHADAIDIAGPGLTIERDAAGDLHTLGFKADMRRLALVIASLSAKATTNSSGTVTLQALPHIEIGHFAWKGIHLGLVDGTVSPPTSLNISDCGITAENFFLNPSENSSHAPGAVQAWLALPGVAGNLRLDGTVASTPRQIALKFDVKGEELCLNPLAVYLKPLGVEPIIQSGALALHGDLSLNDTPDGLSASFSGHDIAFTDGDKSIVSVDSMQLGEMRSHNGELFANTIDIASPHSRVVRRADSSIEAGGFHFTAENAIATTPSSNIPVTHLQSVKVDDAQLEWVDQTMKPAVDLTAHLKADVTAFTFGATTQPANVNVTCSVPGVLESLAADGTLTASASDQTANLNVTASGIQAGAAAAYLPPGIRATLRQGAVRSAAVLSAAHNPRGGETLDVALSNFDYRDAAEDTPLLAFDQFHAHASRFDPAGKVIALDDLSVSGLETALHTEAKTVALLGVEVGPAADAPAESAPTTKPATKAVSGDSRDVLRQIAAARDQLPLISLHSLDLNCRQITIHDDTGAIAAPLVLSNLHVHNTADIEWLGRDIESNPQTQLQITGRLAPVADDFKIDTGLTPFPTQKSLHANFAISGIHGAGLTALAPALANYVNADDLKSGRLKGSVGAALNLQTVRGTDFSFDYGGQLTFNLSDINFYADANGPVVAGVHDIRSEGVILAPHLSSVEMRELDVDGIVGHIVRDDSGIHLLGVIAKIPTTLPASVLPSPSAIPKTEVKIDRLLVTGLTLPIEDRTVNPPFVAPISGLDVEAVGISSLSMQQNKPIRFSAVVSSGKIQLPRRGGSTTQPDSGQLFSQITADGVVSLYPNLKGWTKASVSGFDLASLRSMAAKRNVTLNGGTFDGDLDLRFPGDGSIDAGTQLALTDLSVSDSPNAVITQSLHLPGALDDIIGLLQDQDGTITIPLNVTIRQQQLDPVSVAAAASGAFLEVVTRAVASAPLKGVGLLGAGSHNQPEQPVVVTFPAGYPELAPAQAVAMKALALRLRKDPSLEVTIRHDLGADDIALAAERVNPTLDEASDLANSLGRRRDELLDARLGAVSDVRALLASTAATEAAAAAERLRTINRELADIEAEQDQVYNLSRPGADRQAIRRTRAASLEIAAARIQAVRELLLGEGRTRIVPERIHTSNPQFTQTPEKATGYITIVVIKTK